VRTGGSAVVGWGNGFIIDWLPGSLANVVQVAAGEGGGVALLADGTVRAWGVSAVVNVPPDLDDVVAIEGGGVFFALRSDGTVVSWGHQIVGGAPIRNDLEAMLP